MSTLVAAPAAVEPIHGPPERHGKCRLTLRIHATEYVLSKGRTNPRGVVTWNLRAINGDRPGKVYCVAVVSREAGCTCPDATVNGAVCKHLGAMRAAGLISKKALTPQESEAEARRLASAKKRRAAAPKAAPMLAPASSTPRRGLRKHAPVSPAEFAAGELAAPTIRSLPVPTAQGWNEAVRSHVAALGRRGVN